MRVVQAWEREAAAEHGALTSERKWEAGRQLVTSLGDLGSAERCMIHSVQGLRCCSIDSNETDRG